MKPSHVHVISCCLSELKRRSRDRTTKPVLRILDAGCGNGLLMTELLTHLRESGIPEIAEIYGFEVLEHRGIRASYCDEVHRNLEDRFPGIDWESRIKMVSASEAWPFLDEEFDLVISNQVIEHVTDLGWFFEEQRRVLKSDGFTIHHFPTAESIVDPHSGIPFAHWPKSNRSRAILINFFSRIGIGKFLNYRRDRGHTLNQFLDEFLSYLRLYTHYRSLSEVEAIASRVGLRVNARYNWALFRRWANGDHSVYPYSSLSTDRVFLWVLSRFTSSTIVCNKR